MLQPTPGSPRDLLGVGCWWFFMFGRHIHKWLLYLFHKGFPERYMYVCIHYVYIHTFFKKWRHVLGTSSKFPHCWCQNSLQKKRRRIMLSMAVLLAMDHSRNQMEVNDPPPPKLGTSQRNIWSFQLSKKMVGQDQLCGYCLVNFEGI